MSSVGGGPEPTGILPRCGDGVGTGVRFLVSRSPTIWLRRLLLRGLLDVFISPLGCMITGGPNGAPEAEQDEHGNPEGA